MDPVLEREYSGRLENVRKEALRRGYSCLLIFGLAPRRVGDLMYLTGHQPVLPGHPRRYNFRGRGMSAIVLSIDQEASLVVTTPFYESDLFIKNIKYGDNLPEEISKSIKAYGLQKTDIGIVGTDILPVSLYYDLKAELNHARFFPADDIVMNLRAAKSPYEIELLRTGAHIADEVSVLLRQFLAPGISENDVFSFITLELTKRGVTGAYATCQSGWRSERPAFPEASTDKLLENGDLVLMEINGKYQGYMIDVCRSAVIGKPSVEQLNILNTDAKIFQATIAAMRPGISAESLDKLAADIAKERGFEHNMTRAFGGPATLLGHAIGLGVDEPPVIALGDKTQLVQGMVITIEPGIYDTGFGGCRIEDEILVTQDGWEDLNQSEYIWW